MDDLDNEEYLNSLLENTNYWNFHLTFEELGYDIKTAKKLFVRKNPKTLDEALNLLAEENQKLDEYNEDIKPKKEENIIDIKPKKIEEDIKPKKEENIIDIEPKKIEEKIKPKKEENIIDTEPKKIEEDIEDNQEIKKYEIVNDDYIYNLKNDIKLEDIKENEVEETLILENNSEEKFDLEMNIKKKLYYKGKKSICKIIKDNETGIGFFFQINLKERKIRFLFTNSHILNKDFLIFENEIKCQFQQKEELIILDISQERRFFTNEKLNYTAIEIFEYDGIEHFFEIENDEKNLSNEKIGMIEFLNDKIKIKTGQINEINDLEIKHNINENDLLTDSPIFLLNENINVIGFHTIIKGEKNNHYNTFIKNIINDMNKNEIICEHVINNEIMMYKLFNTKVNIKQLKDSIDLYMNDEKINFCFKSRFPNKNKNTLKLVSNKLYLIENIIFYDCSSLTSLNLSNFNTNIILDMNDMFCDCVSLTNIDLSNINTNNVTTMKKMFYNCFSLKSLNLSNFNTSNVEDMKNMFSGCTSLTTLDLSNFNTQKVKNMAEMFYNCKSLYSIKLSNNFTINNVIDMNSIFSKCSSLINLDLSNFNINKVNNMNNMFSNCQNLSTLKISNLNTDNVINMCGMFSECYLLDNLDLSKFNTNNVENMNSMFNKCGSLKSLDLSNFNTDNVRNMKKMFSDCTSLEKLNISNFTFNKNTNYREIFTNCKSLKQFDINNITYPDKNILNKILNDIDKKCEIIQKN